MEFVAQASDEVIFREEQRFPRWIVVGSLLLAAGLIGMSAYMLIMRFLLGESVRVYGVALSDAEVVVCGLCVVLLALACAWGIAGAMLVTEVHADHLHVRLRGQFLNRRIPFDGIARCYARTYNAMQEYGGRGRSLSGAACTISGSRGVQLELTSGKKILIGSQRAEELARAICEHLPS